MASKLDEILDNQQVFDLEQAKQQIKDLFLEIVGDCRDCASPVRQKMFTPGTRLISKPQLLQKIEEL